MRCTEAVADLLWLSRFRSGTHSWFEDIIRADPEGQTQASECLKLTAQKALLVHQKHNASKIMPFFGRKPSIFRVSLPVLLCPGARTTTIEAVATIWIHNCSQDSAILPVQLSDSIFRWIAWGFAFARSSNFPPEWSRLFAKLRLLHRPPRFKDLIFCVVRTFSLAGSTKCVLKGTPPEFQGSTSLSS